MLTLIELRLALISYQDYHMFLLTLAGPCVVSTGAAGEWSTGLLQPPYLDVRPLLGMPKPVKRKSRRGRDKYARTFSYQDHHMLCLSR